jgi:DNA-binding IclR family transcriptional regulator
MPTEKLDRQNIMAPASSHERVLMVLMALAQAGRPLSLVDLIEKTGLPKSTLYRQLAILKRWEFVFGFNNLYAPGPVSLQLALGFDEASLLTQYAKHDMQKLTDQSHESVALSTVIHQQAVCVEMTESSHSLRCSFEKGRSVPLREGATAKCLLAHLPETRREAILQSEFPDISEQERRRQLLLEIRTQGYACSDSEIDLGVWGISAPLFSRGRYLLGTLTLMAPSIRAREKESGLVQMALDTAEHINEQIQSL